MTSEFQLGERKMSLNTLPWPFEIYHVKEGETVRFISANGNEYVGVVHKVREFHNSSLGNLIIVKLDNGSGYRSFYEGMREHEVLPF